MDKNANNEKKYSEFRRMNYINAHKYRRNPKKLRKYILWPFIVILPFYFLSLFLSNKLKQDEVKNNPEASSKLEIANTDQALQSTLEEIFKQMPHTPSEHIIQNILTHKMQFVEEISDVIKESPSELLMLVDKTHALSQEFAPQELIELDSYSDQLFLNRKGLKLNTLALEPLIIMSNAAKKDGVSLLISSTYRSYEYQNTLFNYYVEKEGRKKAERESAIAGTSQHQLGLAIDFGSISPEFADTRAGKWLAQHATQYGFSLSYPHNGEYLTGYIYESWHFRYLGIRATQIIDTYFDGTQQYFLEFIHSIPQNSDLFY